MCTSCRSHQELSNEYLLRKRDQGKVDMDKDTSVTENENMTEGT